MGSGEKDLSIETLRGFAIVFMVAGHIIGGNLTGMKVAENSVWRYFYFTLEYLRMPFFTVISGYVYSLRPAGNSNIFKFLRGKSRRLILPLFTVGTLHFLMQHFVPGTNVKLPIADLWKIYIFPYEHFWFLQSIFLIFIFIGIIDQLKQMDTFRNWLIILIAVILIRQFTPPLESDLFSVNRFLNLLPFFVLGCGIERYKDFFNSRLLIRILIVVFILCMILQQYTWFAGITLDLTQEKVLGIIEACAGITFVFFIRKNITLMSKIGYYAFGIYLFHVLGTAGSRIFLMKLGVAHHYILFIFGLIFGLGIPILIELVFERVWILKRVFFGIR